MRKQIVGNMARVAVLLVYVTEVMLALGLVWAGCGYEKVARD